MAPSRFPRSLCRYRLLPEIDPGTLCRQTTAGPGTLNGISLWPELYEPGYMPALFGMDEAITEADKAEFKIVRKMSVADSTGKPFQNINQYISARTLYFGPPSAYLEFAAESDAELANTKWPTKKYNTLRSRLEFNKRSQVQQQQIFYRWVRKAYKKKYGADVNVPEMVRKGMSQELADKIAEVRASARVKSIHEEDFKAGGFNPRPAKLKVRGVYRYRLGTLSEHATGMAIDINDKENPQLSTQEWNFIQTLVGKQFSRFNRWDKETDAEGLWKDIKDLSDQFVTKVAAEVKRIEKARAEKEAADKLAAEKAKAEKVAAGAPVVPDKPPKVLPPPLEEVLGVHFKGLSPWVTNGFLSLPLDLVLEFHAHGFKWGATFQGNVDLHHFELPD